MADKTPNLTKYHNETGNTLKLPTLPKNYAWKVTDDIFNAHDEDRRGAYITLLRSRSLAGRVEEIRGYAEFNADMSDAEAQIQKAAEKTYADYLKRGTVRKTVTESLFGIYR